ncbi:MAG: TusE/DsrC/DsvC family sulfur relay protein [Chloroflexota bacterium]|nr:TusE/DsrC/DsvC family sulfur relay protein [Chloroflexota bacterium]
MTTPVTELTVEMDADGFLTDPAAWTPEVAESIAADEGIELSDRHWDVINFVREDYGKTGESPTLRRITKQSGVNTKELYQLFPKGPAKKVARIAGLGKPKGCI